MSKITKLFISVSALLLGIPSFAVESGFSTTDETTTRSSQEYLPSINEDWYTLWGFGLSSVDYEKEVQLSVNTIKSASGVSRTTVNVDLFGFYWPDSSFKTMYGVILNANNDAFENKDFQLSIMQYTLAFSVYHFFGANIGDGWFMRGDIGPSRFVVEAHSRTDGTITGRSDYGLGLMLGGGYSFVIGKETRMPLGLYLAYRSAEGETMTTANINLGFLF